MIEISEKTKKGDLTGIPDQSRFLIRARILYLDFVVFLSLLIFFIGKRERERERESDDKYGFVSVHFNPPECSFARGNGALNSVAWNMCAPHS